MYTETSGVFVKASVLFGVEQGFGGMIGLGQMEKVTRPSTRVYP